jgi:hypothetical protein
MAGKETSLKRKRSNILQQERRLGFRTDRPFLFKVDGGNMPSLRKGESAKSFFTRIKDWEKFTGRKYPPSAQLNRLRLRGTGGTKDYTGPNWQDEKSEWVSEKQAASALDPSLDADIAKEEFLSDSTGYKQYDGKAPVPLNQRELEFAEANRVRAEEARNRENLRISNEYKARQNTGDPFLNAALANQPLAEGHYDPSDNSFTSTKPSTITTKEKSADLNNAVKEELKIADNQSAFKSDVFTIDPVTKKAVGVMTRNERKKFEARADVQAALKATPQNELRIYKNRTGAG